MRRAATQIWPYGIFARGHLWPIISSGDEGTVSLQIRRSGYCTDDNRDYWGEFGGRTRTGGIAPGCAVRYRLIEDPPERSPEQLLEEVRLLLLAPTLSAESRETLLAEMGSSLDAANIPVLTLSTTLKEAPGDGPAFIPWPCRLEDLTKKIEAALLRVSEVSV